MPRSIDASPSRRKARRAIYSALASPGIYSVLVSRLCRSTRNATPAGSNPALASPCSARTAGPVSARTIYSALASPGIYSVLISRLCRSTRNATPAGSNPALASPCSGRTAGPVSARTIYSAPASPGSSPAARWPVSARTSTGELAPPSGQAHHQPRQHRQRAQGAQGQGHARECLVHGPFARQRLAAGPARVDVHRGGREHEHERGKDVRDEADPGQAQGVVEKVVRDHRHEPHEGDELPAAPVHAVLQLLERPRELLLGPVSPHRARGEEGDGGAHGRSHERVHGSPDGPEDQPGC